MVVHGKNYKYFGFLLKKNISEDQEEGFLKAGTHQFFFFKNN
jgi:hypothetical protein